MHAPRPLYTQATGWYTLLIRSGPFTLTPEILFFWHMVHHLCARTRSTVEGDSIIYGSEVTRFLILAELGMVSRMRPITGPGSMVLHGLPLMMMLIGYSGCHLSGWMREQLSIADY